MNKRIFVGITLFFLLLVSLNSFSHIRSTLTDGLMGARQPSENVVILAIDDASIQEIGRWPWDRTTYISVLDKLKNAKAIGMDISFFEPTNSDSQLQDEISKTPQLVLASEYDVVTGKKLIPVFTNVSTGIVNVQADSDGIVRSISTANAFSQKIYETAFPTKTAPSTPYQLNFYGPPRTFKIVSLSNFLNSSQGLQDVTGKIVLIGATAPDLHDEYFVPTSLGNPMSGVEIHATAISNILDNSFVKKENLWITALLTLIASMIGYFAIARLKIFVGLPLIVVSCIAWIFGAIYLFDATYYQTDLFFVPCAIIFSTLGSYTAKYLKEKRKAQHVSSVFGKFISADVVKQLTQTEAPLKLGGAKQTITIFFSDIRGFTSTSEKTTPQQLVKHLNAYFDTMTKIILNKSGTVDKFIGDAIMAFWNAPLTQKDHALLACNAAIEQIRALAKLKEKGFPDWNIGCGIHTGDAVVGMIGSLERVNYTAIGDSVNLASRLESLTKTYGVSIIISEAVQSQIKKSNDELKANNKLPTRKLDIVKVKGKTQAITIYELCVDEPSPKFLSAYNDAFEKYMSGSFSDAIKLFETANRIKKNTASQLLIERCKYLQQHPPKNWNGVYEFKTK